MHCRFTGFVLFPVAPDQRASVAPLFEAQLDLKVPDMVFTPPLELGTGDSFYELVESLINDVFRVSSLVPRLAQHSPFPHYQVLYWPPHLQHVILYHLQRPINMAHVQANNNNLSSE